MRVFHRVLKTLQMYETLEKEVFSGSCSYKSIKMCIQHTIFFMHSYLSSNKILCDNLVFTVVYECSNVERGSEHGIEGTDLNFEFKMASLGNVVFIDRRIMDFAFLISLTHKTVSSARLLPSPASSLFYGLYFSGDWLPSSLLSIHV